MTDPACVPWQAGSRDEQTPFVNRKADGLLRKKEAAKNLHLLFRRSLATLSPTLLYIYLDYTLF